VDADGLDHDLDAFLATAPRVWALADVLLGEIVDLCLRLVALDHLDHAAGDVDLLHRVLTVGDREPDARVPAHVALLHAALGRVEGHVAVLHVCPDGCHLRRSVLVDRRHEKQVGRFEELLCLVRQLCHSVSS
jgi:hypothetical protein